MVIPGSWGDEKQPANDAFLDVDGVPSFPPMKRMRGSVTTKIAHGDILGASLKPILTGEVRLEQSWALVPYNPPTILSSNGANEEGHLPKPSADRDCPIPSSNGTNAEELPSEWKESQNSNLPKPAAARDCPPGMRIRGGRQMPPMRQAAPKRMERKPKIVKRKVDGGVVTLSSDSDTEVKPDGPLRHSASVSKKKSGFVRTNVKKQKEHGDIKFKFELKSDALPRTRVEYILQQFDNLRRHYLSQEEQRVKAVGSGSKRADLRASSTLMGSRSHVNGNESIYGEVPGVEVGDHYYYRMELLLISLHRQSQAGIDFIPASKSQFRDKNGQRMSVAVSVIASGGYQDDKDEGDTLTYTGQGGNNFIGNKQQEVDQKLERGNLALHNSCDHGLSVRVIRGCDFKKTASNQAPSGRIYYYDGLYDVVQCFQEKGSAGFKVWKFKLVRKAGQGALSSRLVLFKGKALGQVLRDRGERIVSEDLSGGMESFKVRVVGSVDEDQVPSNFEYITSLRYSPGMPKPLPPTPCVCSHVRSQECYRRNDCECIALNVVKPYNDEGGLLRAKRLVYECGPLCGCFFSQKCTNRVAQLGLRSEMEVFKTKGKGWGVRSSYFIPQGSFVCEYIGEIIHETDAEKRVSDDEYMFDLKIPVCMERRFGEISGMATSSLDEDGDDDANCEKYTVDANRCGNLARFINHSCKPNLFVQCVLYDHHDHRFPHIMLFASQHISPYKELTYDYGYEIDKVMGADGKIKIKKCYCGVRSCRGRMY